MSQSKKRPKPTEEDLEAAVADMINSPITRANLSFLRPTRAENSEPEPAGPSPKPSGLLPDSSADLSSQPSPTVCLIEVNHPVVVESRPIDIDPTPIGVETKHHGGVVQRQPLWQAEGIGAVFEQSRVRRIQKATDALSKVEAQVYEMLWGTPALQSEGYRLVHYSLQRIAIDSNINIKTVREMIPRLIDKGFLEIEHPADVRRNIPTLYRVWSDSSVLENQQQRDRMYVARTGKGVFYVHPIAVSIQARPGGYEPAPMGPSSSGHQTEHASSSPLIVSLAEIISQELGTSADTDALNSMVMHCHENATITTGEPATESELLYFTEVKARGIARSGNIRNHLRVLQRAVPSCFLGDTFRAFRQTRPTAEASLQKRPASEV